MVCKWVTSEEPSSREDFLRLDDPGGRYSSGSKFTLDFFGDFVDDRACVGFFAADYEGAALHFRRWVAVWPIITPFCK